MARNSYVYDVIADFDGKAFHYADRICRTMPLRRAVAQLRQLLKQLKRYLRDNRIVTMSLKPQDILCHRIS
ncbi:hypothetical protein DMH88_05465 [Escherichia coli]|nr:hypothetical protein [Escherichia coli]